MPKSRPTVKRIGCRNRSWSSPRKTPSSSREPIRCPRVSSTVSCCEFRSDTPSERMSCRSSPAIGPANRSTGSSRCSTRRRSLALQEATRRVAVEESIADYLLDIVSATRQSSLLQVGVSTRGGTLLVSCHPVAGGHREPRLCRSRRRQAAGGSGSRPPRYRPLVPSGRTSGRRNIDPASGRRSSRAELAERDRRGVERAIICAIGSCWAEAFSIPVPGPSGRQKPCGRRRQQHRAANPTADRRQV